MFQEEIVYCEGGETLAQVAQSLWMPLPGSIQGQAGWGCEQPGLVVGDPAHSRGVETPLWPEKDCGPFQPRPFYDMIL